MSMINTGTNDLLASLENGVAVLTLNRPDARNAMSGPMNAALQTQLAELELNPAVKCIVLTGAGKGFCAGGRCQRHGRIRRRYRGRLDD